MQYPKINHILKDTKFSLDVFKDAEIQIVEERLFEVKDSHQILEQELDYKNFERTNATAWETQERARVYKDDILTYTTGANIGRTQVYLSSERAFASNHVNLLRIIGENPIYVAFVIIVYSGMNYLRF